MFLGLLTFDLDYTVITDAAFPYELGLTTTFAGPLVRRGAGFLYEVSTPLHSGREATEILVYPKHSVNATLPHKAGPAALGYLVAA